MTATPSPRSAALRAGVAALLAVAAPATVLLLRLTLTGDLPEPLPVHWGPGGEVDATATLDGFTTIVGALTVLGAALVLGLVAVRDRLPVAPEATATLGWLTWLLAAVYAQVLLTAHGAATAQEVSLSWLPVAAVVAAPALPAVALYRLLRRTEADLPPAPASSLRLGADEKVVWVGSARNPVLVVVGWVLLVGGALAALRLDAGAAFVALPGALLVLISSLSARVDREAVTVRWGALGLPRHRLPLGRIAGARVEEVQPLRWGGWGYRVSTRGRATVVRRGAGVVLQLTDGREFAITVDRPEGAVELVNALVGAPDGAGTPAH